ncbi:MAG: Hsp20/alpha crystallin family protein [Verrucomicrobiia bacterium]
MAFDDIEKLRSLMLQFRYEISHANYYASGGQSVWCPPVNLLKSDDKIVVCMDVPGVEKNDIRIKAEERRLLISGVRKFPEPKEKTSNSWSVLAMEIDYGEFERVINLPEKINPEYVKAEYNNGVLWITMPLARVETED